MWKTLIFAMLLALGIVAPPATAHAQPSSDDTKLAEDLAQQAYDAHAKGEFVSSIALYMKAYQLTPVGVILFNIGNIYDRKLGDKKQALDYYQRYLRSSDAEPAIVKRASERIDAIRIELEDAGPEQAESRLPLQPDAAPRPVSTTSPETVVILPSLPVPDAAGGERGLQIAGLVGAAAGLGGIVLGSVYGFRARSRNDQASEICSGSVCPDQRGVALTDEAHRAARISTWSFIAGGALVAGGVGLSIYARSRKGERKHRTAIRIAPRVGGLAISGVWP